MRVRYVYWQEEDMWLGYLEELPDYWTQGSSSEDLQEHLKDLYNDLTFRAGKLIRAATVRERSEPPTHIIT